MENVTFFVDKKRITNGFLTEILRKDTQNQRKSLVTGALF